MKLYLTSVLIIALSIGSSSAEEYILAKKGFLPTPGTTHHLYSGLKFESTLDMEEEGKETKTVLKMHQKNYEQIEFVTNKKILTTLTSRNYHVID